VDKTQLKQRIVGAIVLVALGVIFIPIILERDGEGISGSNIPDKPKELAKLTERELPPRPSVPEKPQTTRTLVDEHTPAVQPEKMQEAKPESTDQAKPETEITKVSETTDKKARAWVVQVASFSERKKALSLRDKLRKANYATFVEAINTKQDVLYRVRVGPVVKRSEAEIMQKKIIKQFNLKDALVMSHP